MRRFETPSGTRPEPVRIWLLGGFQVSVGSRTIQHDEWRLRKAASLLKLLVLAPGHRLHREQLMDVLWPNSATRAASNNFRQVIYAARKVLDPASDTHKSYLSLQDEHLILCPEGQLWVDVDAFEEVAATARRARDTAVYRAAIDLYTGDLLPEDRYEEWVENRREELRQLYLALLVELARVYEERDEHSPAIEALRKVMAKEPTLEEAHVSLMRLHALSGRPEQALAQYERLRDALYRGLGTEPGATTRDLRDEIAAGRFSPAPPAGALQNEKPSEEGKHNLPAPRTSFVGREREMVEVKRTLYMARLLTLTGAGGSGKTRLALEVARDLIGAYPDGVWLVELASLSEPDLVTQEVAVALEVSERPGQTPTDTLVEALADKEMLLVVDNCEHLVEVAARLVDALLDSCPRLTVLATSREPLGVSGEVNRSVPPLSLPDTGEGSSTVEDLTRYEAVRLFVDRARLRLPDFQLTQENSGAVARVCQKLDGIPLAIELATARMGALAVEQIAQRLERSLDVLKGASRTAEARQKTLRATLDWSHNLLSEAERAFFGRLSVFAGGWTLETAEAVCSGGGTEQEDVLDLLGGLVDKSLVAARASTGGALRYRMLEPIRQYAQEKLKASGEADEVQDRHAAFFFDVAELAEPELAGAHQKVWVERLEEEHDNLREALSWVLQREEAELGLRFGAALWRFWFASGYLSEGTKWMEQTLTGSGPALAPSRVRALEGMGWLRQAQGDVEQAKATYEEMLKLSREIGDMEHSATALNSLAALAAQQGDPDRARALLEENLAVLRELEDKRTTATILKRFHVLILLGHLAMNEEGDYTRAQALWEESLALACEAEDALRIGVNLTFLSVAALVQGNYERATTLCEEALALAREKNTGEGAFVPETLINLGLASLGRADHRRARASFEEALSISRTLGKKPTLIEAVEGMASLAAARGEATRAARLWGAAEAAREATGITLPSGDRALHEPYLPAARSRLGEELWEAALVEGREMSLEGAVEYAIAKVEEPAAPTFPMPDQPSADQLPVALTPREKEIALLVAKDLTNRQIASELTLSEHTVATHVRNVIKKLGLYSRNQVAAWLGEHQPLQ